ncbi:hypothetical protein [Clostridium tarantellae]|uniref:Glycosyltransferase RgtA/B/C/D-like domain-containing protein n=1 Tax=Clostridium tarantellae TaxID=39493 RepID=A0A6I1MQL4_9CLOT|nr:hypothetical protein [Clostridium tarantellae]MPQ42589.1 hypothetical protein [Clostridium tarantellae]
MNDLSLKKNKITYYIILVSLIFLCIIGSVFLGSSFLFIFKIPITRINFLIFPIIAIVVIKYLFKKDNEKISWTFLIFTLLSFFLISGILAIVCNYIWDYSYDSLWYHQEGIVRLAKDWNPFYEWQPKDINIWVNHYAKAPWIFAATICKITGYIETGKILSVLLPIISGFLSFAIFYLITKGRIFLSSIGALILIMNPVNISQIFTYYVDSQQGCYIIFLLMILYLIIFTKGFKYFKYFSLFNIAIFLSNIKFTGLAYSIAILGMYLIYVFITKENNKKIKVFNFLLISLIITVGIVGFNPYITNIINKGNPLYPLAGKEKIDIMTDNIPSEFRYDNEFNKLIKSLIAYPIDENIYGNRTDLKDMFVLNEDVIKYYSNTDPRVRGFGIYSPIFFPITLLLMCILLIISKNKKVKIVSILCLIGLIGITLYGGEFWWARYMAFTWIFPVLTAILCCINKKNIIKISGSFLLVLLFINSITLIPSLKYKIKKGKDSREYFFSISKPIEILNDKFKYSKVNKAEEYHISYIIKEIN